MKEMDAYKNVITDYNNWWYEIQIDAFNSNGKSNGFFDPRSHSEWRYPYKDDYPPRPPALQINPTPSPTTSAPSNTSPPTNPPQKGKRRRRRRSDYTDTPTSWPAHVSGESCTI